MTLLQFTEETLQEIAWVKGYAPTCNNTQKVEMIEHYLNMFHVPAINQQELIINFSTMLPESPEYNLLQTYAKAMGLTTSYLKVGTKEHLCLQITKGFFK